MVHATKQIQYVLNQATCKYTVCVRVYDPQLTNTALNVMQYDK